MQSSLTADKLAGFPSRKKQENIRIRLKHAVVLSRIVFLAVLSSVYFFSFEFFEIKFGQVMTNNGMFLSRVMAFFLMREQVISIIFTLMAIGAIYFAFPKDNNSAVIRKEIRCKKDSGNYDYDNLCAECATVSAYNKNRVCILNSRLIQ